VNVCVKVEVKISVSWLAVKVAMLDVVITAVVVGVLVTVTRLVTLRGMLTVTLRIRKHQILIYPGRSTDALVL
jgi:hypothetical protein